MASKEKKCKIHGYKHRTNKCPLCEDEEKVLSSEEINAYLDVIRGLLYLEVAKKKDVESFIRRMNNRI